MGRSRIHADNAARQAAYRSRKAAEKPVLRDIKEINKPRLEKPARPTKKSK